MAVLDGGYPAWAARGLPKEIDSVPAEDVEAPGEAAQSSPGNVSYKATLQARALSATQPTLCRSGCSLVKAGFQPQTAWSYHARRGRRLW